MNHRLIYGLIALMLVSLIGIIVVQTSWISDAFASVEREYQTHINDALNRVNTDIDEDEAILFVENHLGGMDSLLQELIVIQNGTENAKDERIIVRKRGEKSQNKEVHFEWRNEISVYDSLIQPFEQNEMRIEHGQLNDPKLTTRIEMLADSHRIHQVSTVVRQFSTERFFSGNLENRISKKELRRKIKEALKSEGLPSSCEFSVYDELEKKFLSTHTSKGFDAKLTHNFTKSLFENDRLQKAKFTLHLQFPNQHTFVWAKIRPMILLAVLFSILILFCFGYSLYFIFKQKKISQVKNDFINNMTHELKTPLASISLAAASIRHPQVIERAEEVKRFADIISDEERKINRHIEQVLEIAQIDRGEFELQVQSIDLIRIVERSFEAVQLTLEHAGGHLEWDKQISHAPVIADEMHLTNAFSNILDNSIKYRRDRLKIAVRLSQEAGFFQIDLEDNGIGMRPHECAQAFDKFYRAEFGNIHNRKGFGLGLSYVKRIVELHKGEIRLDSEYNKGTRVRIRIPVANED